MLWSGYEDGSNAGWFTNMASCADMELNKFDTSNVATLENAFFGCQALQNLERNLVLEYRECKKLGPGIYVVLVPGKR